MSFFNFASRRPAPCGAVAPSATRRDGATGLASRLGLLFQTRAANRTDILNDRLLRDIGLSRADYEALRD